MDSPSSDPLVVQLSTSGSSFPSNTEKIADNIPRPRGGNKRKESPVWQWVYKIGFINDRGEKDAYAKCKKCELVMPGSTKRNGTTGIRNHLMKCEGNDLYVPPSSSQTTLSQKDFGGELVAHHFNQKRSDVKILEWIIRAEQPFRVVEHPAFKAFIQELQPKFKVPNRKKVASGIWDMFMSEKTKILEIIGDLRISVTTDTWTSIQNINYMVVTAHFLDSDWKLHKRIINFTKITSHKGEDIARVLDGCLSDWGIKKIFSVTVDNATANDKAIEYMKKRLKSRGTLLLDGIHLHMRCACHIINLIVKDGLKELGSSIEGIRNCVKFIHSSPARLDMFRNVDVLENMDKMANVPMDVVTRWNATYGMLTSAYKYKNVFARMLEENEHFQAYFDEMVSKDIGGKKVQTKREGPPVEEDWERSEGLAHFLRKFYDATLRLSATSTPSSHLILETLARLKAEIESKISDFSCPTMQDVANQMKKKFDKYWGKINEVNPIIFIAQVLDPTIKLDMIDSVMEAFSATDGFIVEFKE